MANLREAYAGTVLAGLQWDETRERAVDRVAAGGRASPEIDIWKAAYGLEAGAYRRLEVRLLRVFSKRYPLEVNGARIVSQALHEYLSPHCTSCRGAREVVVGERRVVCPSCNGGGIRRYGDAERAQSMGLSYGLTKRLAHKIRWLLGVAGEHDRLVNSLMCFELERD